jgi:hypothetical protein
MVPMWIVTSHRSIHCPLVFKRAGPVRGVVVKSVTCGQTLFTDIVVRSCASVSILLAYPAKANGAAAREADLLHAPLFLLLALFGSHTAYIHLFGGHGHVALACE